MLAGKSITIFQITPFQVKKLRLSLKIEKISKILGIPKNFGAFGAKIWDFFNSFRSKVGILFKKSTFLR